MVAKKIVFLITGLRTGGAEMMLYKICSKIDRSQFTPIVISLSDKSIMGPQIESLGVQVHALNMSSSRPTLKGWFHMKKLLSEIKPDLIQGWMYHGNLVANLIGGKAPVLWGIRQSLYDLAHEKRATKIVILLGAALSKKVSHIVYNSKTSALQHEHIGYSKDHGLTIPNGFDTEVFKPDQTAKNQLRSELNLDSKTRLVGLIGRYHPMKDQAGFLEAASIVLKENQQVHFLLIGKEVDPQNIALTSLIENLGIKNHVSLMGERQDIPKIVASLDIAVSASAWGEGFANVVGEAMSCGIPLVVTDVGDSAWIVGEAGLVVPPREPAALANACLNILQMTFEESSKLGNKGRERVIQNFSLNSIVKQYENLYNSILLKRGV